MSPVAALEKARRNEKAEPLCTPSELLQVYKGITESRIGLTASALFPPSIILGEM